MSLSLIKLLPELFYLTLCLLFAELKDEFLGFRFLARKLASAVTRYGIRE